MELLKKNLSHSEDIKGSILQFLIGHRALIINTLISFLISRLAVIGDIAPFSIPFVLALKCNIFITAGSILGILSNPDMHTIKYILTLLCGVALYYMIATIFPKISMRKACPAIIFTVSFTFSLIFILFTDYRIYDIFLTILEAFIGTIFYFIMLKGIKVLNGINKKRFFTSEEFACTGIVITCAVAGIGALRLPLDIHIVNIFCIVAVLVGAMYGNIGVSAQISAFMGIAAGLSTGNMGIVIATFAVNGLIASVFSRYGKISNILGFTLGNVVVSILLADKIFMVLNFQEIALGAILFALIPGAAMNRFFMATSKSTIEHDKAAVIKDIATVKLDRLGLAFRKLSDTIHSTMTKTRQINLNNIGTLFDAVADKVCKKCAMRFYCWQKDYDTTMDAMMSIAKAIEKNGGADPADFPEYFSKKCVKSEEILKSLINLYEIYRLNAIWQNKMKENTQIYREQFMELSNIVLNLREEIAQNPYFDKDMSIEIASELERFGINCKSINVIKDCNEKTEIEITLYPCHERDNCHVCIEERLEEIFDIPFYKASGGCTFKECKLLFKESEIYKLLCSVKQSTKPNSEKNGDSYAIKNLNNGNEYIALCDGSGTGKNANIYSSSTLKLLEQFLKTGFSKTASIKLINSSLLNNSENDYFSTIDLCLFDLKNGDLEIIKKGAAPTYIMRANGEFESVKTTSLPVGIVSSQRDHTKKTRLKEDDIIVMVSDGVSEALNKEDWIIDALKAAKYTDTERIADILLKIALSTENASLDDMTVIAGKVVVNHV